MNWAWKLAAPKWSGRDHWRGSNGEPHKLHSHTYTLSYWFWFAFPIITPALRYCSNLPPFPWVTIYPSSAPIHHHLPIMPPSSYKICRFEWRMPLPGFTLAACCVVFGMWMSLTFICQRCLLVSVHLTTSWNSMFCLDLWHEVELWWVC